MDRLAELISYLENKYEHPISFEEHIIKRYGLLEEADSCLGQKEVDENDKIKPKELKNPEKEFLFFQCDKEHNINVINKLINSMPKFERKDFDLNKNDTVTKLLEKYVKELKSLSENKCIDEGEKTAEKYVKILKKTLMKLWENKRFLGAIREYFNQNKIYVEEFEIDHKLSDDELELLDETITEHLSVKTENLSDRYRVIQMLQPIIKVYYEEDEDIYYKLIPGSCRFYA